MWKVEKSITFFILIIASAMISPTISAILISMVLFIMMIKIKEQNSELLKQNEKIIKLLEEQCTTNND